MPCACLPACGLSDGPSVAASRGLVLALPRGWLLPPLTPHRLLSCAEQVDEVKKVKRFENGFILDPFTVGPTATLADLDAIKFKHGFSGCPVTHNGKLGGRLVGIVTTRDHDFVKDRSTLVTDVMTREVVTAPQGCTLEEANQILKDSKKGKLPVVNADGCLVAAISRKDLRKNRDFRSLRRTRASVCWSGPRCTHVPRTRSASRCSSRLAST